MGVEIIEEPNFCLLCFYFDYRRRRSRQQQTVISSSCFKLITSVFVSMLLMFSAAFPATSGEELRQEDHGFRPPEETINMELVKEHLMKVNKPFVKSIQSPDGDTIDCVLVHHQPAFDHPEMKGTKPMDPPARPKGYAEGETSLENYQLWSLSGESCPEGTIPIRRTSEQDILRANSIQKFGRKTSHKSGRKMTRPVSRDPYIHEHAVASVSGDRYYGSKASINVWEPKVTNRNEFSLAQLWLLSGAYAVDANTIESGWQVCPLNYGDYLPRFFVYWTRDNYDTTGCYNLLCSGFVQTTRSFVLGGSIIPPSVYNGRQFDITLMIWKDTKTGNWWLELGHTLIGYWPAYLFTHLRGHATTAQFGGEVVNIPTWGSHTTTQMGSGHFPNEGIGKAAYVRNMQVVDWDNSLIPAYNFQISAERPTCYNVIGGTSRDWVWGNYILFGGPGKSPRCP